MATNYCSTCKYKVDTKYKEYLKRLPTNPTNMNSIILQTIQENLTKFKACDTVPCCNNENNYDINYVDGSLELHTCEELNHHGECKYWVSNT